MSVSLKGILDKSVTFEKGTTVTEGYPVKMSASNTVSDAAADDSFIGIAEIVGDKICAVQLEGTVTLKCSSGTPAVGYNILSADGAGGVSVTATGRSYIVTEVLSDGYITFIL
ncbi:MAG: hypothetical protein ACI4QV_03105 [Acutalibacteraceae bacterium]